MNPKTWHVSEENEDERIDKWLAKAMGASRTAVQQWVRDGYVLVGGKQVKSNYKLQKGDNILAEPPSEEPFALEAEDIPLDIRYEDDDLLVVNKARGMVVHPAPGHFTGGTLVHALLHYTDALSDVNGELRPGIVHRIDKDTSGLMVVAKTNHAHTHLVEQLQRRSLSRVYRALVHGAVSHEEGTIEAPIGRDPFDRQKMAVTDVHAKEAITHFDVLERFSDYTIIRCRLETGRTHQIRVHMAYIGHPVVADPKYGNRRHSHLLSGQALHAEELTLVHPSDSEMYTFHAPLPDDMEQLIEGIRRAGE
ncbi:RluA family pseudouridine synthase [Salicibibacter cibarius]|uniref:Pseudouridine synthase n=1 Tax=Salicibibacter cibarius TaxID=2743000 RepID=A0A7T6Z7X6_9BACI|nr:RluA family pseudouridine synthase [Salicibibacter cibarius]QQK78342.1 RluA family pseudouridine synthase [Salicibibacter cibarius]